MPGEGNEQDDEMVELKKVVDGLWEDYKMQMDIRKRHSEIEDALKKQIDALLEKREEFRAERVRFFGLACLLLFLHGMF